MSSLKPAPSRPGEASGGSVEARRGPDVPGLLRALRSNWILGVLAALIVGFTVASSNFLTQTNWINTSSTATEVLLLALGETFVIISGGIDLSVGATLGLSGMTGAWLMSHLMGSHDATAVVVIAGLVVAVATGMAAGAVNGLLIAFGRIPPFVVTLGTLGIGTGLADLVSNGQEISNIPTWIGTTGNDNLGGWVPVPVLVTVLFVVVTGVALAKCRFGSNTRAVGDNRDAALRAGIPVSWHLVKIYVLAGLLAGIDGILVMSRLAAASPTSGSNDELNAIAAVVIGGASLFGGRGTIKGAVIGTAIISVLLTGLIIVNVPPFWQLVAVGVVLIVAVYLDQGQEALRRR